jgi:hypothetical protein
VFNTDHLSMRNLEQLTLSNVRGELSMSIVLFAICLLGLNKEQALFGVVSLLISLFLLKLGIDDYYLLQCRHSFLKKKNTVGVEPPCSRK